MGYYDDHHNQKRRKNKRTGWLLPSIIGGIVGAVMMLLLLPSFNQSDLSPFGSTEQQGNADDEQNDVAGNNPSTKNMNVNITTQITDVVEQVAPAVVGVVSIQQQSNFWGQQESGQGGTGSGVIYKVENGKAYVVTNQHVISGSDEIEVVLSDGMHVKSTLLGSDLFTDLAVLELNVTGNEKVIEMGKSDNVKVGEPVIAIGSPLGLRFSGSVTQGVISGKQRAIPQDFDKDGRSDWQAEVIQTDAAINPGNSGGALINMNGELIGINSMKIAQSSVEGIGFSIPIDNAKPIIQQLETKGEVIRPYMGVEVYSLEDIPQAEWERTLQLPEEVKGGVYLWTVEPMTPAAQAGLRRLDVITHMDGEQIGNVIDLRKHLYEEKVVGDEMEITYYRDGQKQTTTLTLTSQK
ncbi:S1C family serine protease [Terrihalobacillus insolitus]|uniref:S1C family serine protease n=1 Tax=Terrihalobacillus insolitus TaxID=2950438 RepID=UPI002341077A|nr:trypsin-like peptidase domain-containing protein [Terrihalobacillus insolitus]MDC3415062.1 trypsin-like peptidase domain-containing protein [Terrihalobacillus insolitus]